MPIASDSFTGVDLSRLPAPQVIEPLDFETILAQSLAQFQVYFPAFDATLESEPVMKLIQLFAYRELVLRQRLNDAARAVMPAFATGPDLDALAALFGVERFILTPADPEVGIAEVLESDTDFRRRMVLAPEGFSVAGPVGAYIFHALSADFRRSRCQRGKPRSRRSGRDRSGPGWRWDARTRSARRCRGAPLRR